MDQNLSTGKHSKFKIKISILLMMEYLYMMSNHTFSDISIYVEAVELNFFGKIDGFQFK